MLKKLGVEADEVSILFTTDPEIEGYNRRFLKREGPTDVLSFPLEGKTMEGKRNLGDIIISVDTAFRQAKELNHSFEEEIKLLIIHGLLHLLGYDHEKDEGEMRKLEEELLSELSGGEG